jgi:hypothetical protein
MQLDLLREDDWKCCGEESDTDKATASVGGTGVINAVMV